MIDAVIVELPAPTTVTTPAATVQTEVFELVHVTVDPAGLTVARIVVGSLAVVSSSSSSDN